MANNKMTLFDTSYVAKDGILGWYRQTQESNEWYLLFKKYYLTQGVIATTEKAFAEYCIERDITPPKGFAPQEWHDAAEQWRWSERNQAYQLALANEQEQVYQKRQHEQRENEWALANKLSVVLHAGLDDILEKIHKAQEAIKLGDKSEIKANPMPQLRSVDLERYMKLYNTLGRVSSGLPTDVRETKQLHSGNVNHEHSVADFEKERDLREQKLLERSNGFDNAFGVVKSPSQLIEGELVDD